jgi:dsDNA-specific endonuclease/ATPase MutS2
MARDYEDGWADDIKDMAGKLYDSVTELREEVKSKDEQIDRLAYEVDRSKETIIELEQEIERLKDMAFEEIVREVASEALNK